MNTKLFTLVVLSVLASFNSASAQNSFKLAATLNNTSGFINIINPAQVIATDINADGKVDLVCADMVLTNNGKGVFGSSSSLPSHFRPSGFVAMDVHRDGRVDLVTLTNLPVAPYTESIVVYTNTGPIAFSPNSYSYGLFSSTTNVGNSTPAVNIDGVYQGNGSLAAAGDVYGNNLANLFYWNSLSNSVSLYTNNGSGVFGSNTTFAVKMDLPAVADVNRDGKVDFISCNYSNNIVYIFTNNGSGIYASNASFNVKAPNAVTVADLNGDGWVDLIVRSTTNAPFGYQTNTITIWTNNGSGGFGSNTIFGVGSQHQQVTDVKAAQLFGDGQVDLVFAMTDIQNQANTLIIYTNNGLGYFGSNATMSVGSDTQPAGVAVADVNGDGTLDLISANNGVTDGLTIYTNTGTGLQTGSFIGNSMPVLFTNSFGNLLAADLYRTGRPQLITQCGYNPPTLLILTNDGAGNFGSNAVVTVSGAANNGSVSGLTAADLHGTGSLDLIGIVNYPPPLFGRLTVFTNSGSGIFGTNLTMGFPNSGFEENLYGSVAVADVNGDGKPDVVTLTYYTSGSDTLTVFTNNGAGGFGTNFTQQINISSRFGGSVQVVDLSGNGRPALIVLNAGLSQGTPSQFIVYTNLGGTGPLYNSQNFFDSITYTTLGTNTDAMIVADVNGDSKPDLIFANDNFPGTLTVMTNNGNGGFGLSSSPGVGAYPHALTASDVNSDGKVDLISANWGLITNTSDARGPLSYGTLSVLTNNGAGLFTNTATFSTGPGPTAVVALDVNDDGKPDLISANTTSFTNQSSGFYGTGGNTLSVLLNTSNFWNSVALQTAPSYTSVLTYGQNLNAAGLTGGAVTNEAGAAISGTFTYSNTIPPAGTANYPVTFTPAPPTDYQPISYNVSLTVSQLVAILKGQRNYDGTTNAVFSILSVSNKVGSDIVTITAGSVGFGSANVGTNPITSTNGIVLGGAAAPNYTLSGVSGAVIVKTANNAVVLASSQNPSGHAVPVNFTATLPAYATGTIQFLTNGVNFDNEPLTLGTTGSVANTTLPLGSSLITAVYSGDPNDASRTNSLTQAVEAPQFNTVTLDPSGLIMSGSFGISNATFYVLATTDLTLPLNQWTTVLTNQYDANGNYNFTNAINSGTPQTFYLLQSQ